MRGLRFFFVAQIVDIGKGFFLYFFYLLFYIFINSLKPSIPIPLVFFFFLASFWWYGGWLTKSFLLCIRFREDN